MHHLEAGFGLNAIEWRPLSKPKLFLLFLTFFEKKNPSNSYELFTDKTMALQFDEIFGQIELMNREKNAASFIIFW